MKPYEKHKDSGVEWIGEIPSHWNKLKLGRSFKLIGSGTTPNTNNEKFYFNGKINWLNTGDLNDGFITETNKKVSEFALKETSLNIFPKESIVIALYGATIGKLGHLKIETTTNQACCVISDSDSIMNRFLFYYFLSARKFILTLAYGGGQPNISQELIKQLYIPTPELKEQISIVAFLDHKTALIDEIIAKKERLIELLQAKRQATINEVVTGKKVWNAANQTWEAPAKVKNSGVEWLGEIPENYSIVRLRFLGSCQNGVSASGDYFGSGDPFVSYGDVYKNMELPSSVFGLANSTLSDKSNYSVIEGDVFFTRTSETIEEIGIASTCISTIENAVFAGFLIRFRPKSDILWKGFSKYYFRSFVPRVHFVKEMNLVTRASLSQELLKSLPVVLPSFSNQKKIYEYLEEKNKKYEQLKSKLHTQIQSLKSYRQSLISEAVTGKIDVREWEAPKENILFEN